MELRAHHGRNFGNALWVVVLALGLCVPARARTYPQESTHDANHISAIGVGQKASAASTVSDPRTPSNRRKVTQYVMDFDGDHSLDLATVIEQVIDTYSCYTVQLRLASGAEQSFTVTAPAGGLHFEMHDMTGDTIPNDLIVRPSLLRWLPTVLFKDGHDHYAVVVSGNDPGSMSSDRELAARDGDDRGTFALLSSGFKTGCPIHGGGLFFSQDQEEFLFLATQTAPPNSTYSSSSGRAPPAFVITA